MSRQVAVHGHGDTEQGSNSYGAMAGSQSAFLSGNINNSNINVTIDAHRSANGASSVSVQGSGDPLSVLAVIATSMESIQEVFNKHPEAESNDPASESENYKGRRGSVKGEIISHIYDLCAQYREDIEEVRSELEKLKSESSQSGHGSIRKFASSVKSEHKLEPLKSRLKSICRDLKHQLKHVIIDESSETRKFLDQLSSKLNSRENDEAAKREESLHESQDSLLEALPGKGSARTKEVLERLKRLKDVTNQVAKDCTIIDSLSFPEMDDRELSIDSSHENTNEWAFEDEYKNGTLHLRSWLESGNSLFWIQGNPGSGKSTFMRHVANHARTEDVLQTWAGGQNLIIAKYFSWESGGTAMQMARTGLLRSLLFSIFGTDPSLIREALPNLWERESTNLSATSWTLESLNETLDKVVELRAQSTRFCFFIDGLDEYKESDERSREGLTPNADIASQIKQLASKENVKVCVSSRPWQAFGTVFGLDPDHVLAMQSHTKADMEDYVRSRLEDVPIFKQLAENDAGYENIVEQLAGKANGVWLWLVRAVPDVRQGLYEEETPKDVSQRIVQLPDDLDGLYVRDFKNIRHTRQAAQIFLMSMYAKNPIPFLTLYLAGLFDNDSSCSLVDPVRNIELNALQLETLMKPPELFEQERNDSLGEWSESDVQKVIEQSQKAIDGRCQAFMKVIQSTADDKEASASRDRLVFCHRSCLDFLQNREEELHQWASQAFDVNRALIKAYYNHIHFVPREQGIDNRVESLMTLMSSILYCNVQIQNNTQVVDPELLKRLSSLDVQELESVKSVEQSDADSVCSNADDDENSTGKKHTKILSKVAKSINSLVDIGLGNMMVSILNYCHDALTRPRKALLYPNDRPLRRRKKIRNACLGADTTGSLWIAVHMVYMLVSLIADLNQLRGRASIWGCWLQMLRNIPRDQANNPQVQRCFQKVTSLQLVAGANMDYVMESSSLSKGKTAVTILEEVLDQESMRKCRRDLSSRLPPISYERAFRRELFS